jgi:hypothetical protein
VKRGDIPVNKPDMVKINGERVSNPGKAMRGSRLDPVAHWSESTPAGPDRIPKIKQPLNPPLTTKMRKNM